MGKSLEGLFMKTLLTVLTLTLMITVGASEAEAAQCKVELKNGRGKLLEVFRGHGYDRQDACQEAKQQCRRVKRGGYYRAPIQTCEKVRRGNGHRNNVSMSCTARLTGPRGHRTFQTFYASAVARDRYQAKEQACMQARRQCQNARSRAGNYGGRGSRGQCVVDSTMGRDYGRDYGRDHGRAGRDVVIGGRGHGRTGRDVVRPRRRN